MQKIQKEYFMLTTKYWTWKCGSDVSKFPIKLEGQNTKIEMQRKLCNSSF